MNPDVAPRREITSTIPRKPRNVRFAPRKRTLVERVGMSALCRKRTLGNDGLLRFSSRFFDQCCHLGCVRKKDRVAARKFNDLRLRPLRHESLEVRIDQRLKVRGPDALGRKGSVAGKGPMDLAGFDPGVDPSPQHRSNCKLLLIAGEISALPNLGFAMSLNGSGGSGKGSPEQVEEGHHRQAQKEPEERAGHQRARHVEIKRTCALPCGFPAYSAFQRTFRPSCHHIVSPPICTKPRSAGV